MILNFLKINIISLNLLVIIWCNLCFNSYRLELEESYQVPNSLYFNRSFFLMVLNSYINTISLITIVLNMGRETEYKLYYLINLIFSCSIGIIDYLEYDNCDDRCQDLLGRHNLYEANTLIRYLSLFQLLITVDYICLGVFFSLNKITENPLQLNSLYAEQLTPTHTPTDMVSPVGNQRVSGQLIFNGRTSKLSSI